MASIKFNVVSKITGLPVTGAAGSMSVQAWDVVTKTARPVTPSIAEVGGGDYNIVFSEADKEVGTVILVTTANEPIFWAFAVFKDDGSNQFSVMVLIDPVTKTLWSGAAPTITSWTGSVTPSLETIVSGLYIISPTALDISESALGAITSPAGAAPPSFTINMDPIASVSVTTPKDPNPGDFYVTGAELLDAGTIRVTFSKIPWSYDATVAVDATNKTLWTVLAPVPKPVAQVQTVDDDPYSFDLKLGEAAEPGTLIVTAGDAISTTTEDVLVYPKSATLTVTATDLQEKNKRTSGTSYQLLKKLVPRSSMSGPAWNAFLAALAVEDRRLSDLGAAAFQQLFWTTAEGNYLTQRAADQGIGRPRGTGLSDESFRKLIAALANDKLTDIGLWEILEVFYGRDLTRAYLTSLKGPFALVDGMTLTFESEGVVVPITFHYADFTSIGAATATEVAAVVGDAFEAVEAPVEVAIVDGAVRLYALKFGQTSTLRCLGGTAQRILQFPTILPVVDELTFAPITWAVTAGFDTVTASATMATSNGFDLTPVLAGDYVVVNWGSTYLANGSYEITDVQVSVGVGTVTYTFTVKATGSNGSVNQSAASELVFGRGERAEVPGDVVLDSVVNGEVRVDLPATSTAVERTLENAAYVRDDGWEVVGDAFRHGNTLTISFPVSHGFSSGDMVEVYDFVSTPGIVIHSGTLGSLSDYSFSSIWTTTGLTTTGFNSALDRPLAIPIDSNRVVCALGGVAGGHVVSVGVPSLIDGMKQYPYSQSAITNSASKLTGFAAGARTDAGATDTILVTGGWDGTGSFSNGTREYSADADSWTTSTLPGARYGHTLSHDPDTAVDNWLITGGASDDTTVLNSVLVGKSGSWVSAATMHWSRVRHAACVLNDGRILVSGGMDLTGGGSLGVLAPGESFTGLQGNAEVYLGLSSDFGFSDSWSEVGAPSYLRFDHTLVKLSDGTVLAIGGQGYLRHHTAAVQPILVVERFDPTSNSWSIAGQLLSSLINPSAAILENGEILLAGLGQVQILNPATMEFRASWAETAIVESVNVSAAPVQGIAMVNSNSKTLYQPGDPESSSGQVDGVFEATVLNSTTISVQTPGSGWTQGTVMTKPQKQSAASVAGYLGPYLYEENVPAISSTETVATDDVVEGASVGLLNVANATAFPDEEGFLLLDFGKDTQQGPVPYLGRASGTSLYIDYNYVFVKSATQPTVSLVTERVVPEPTVGRAILTDSAAGTRAAIKTLRESMSGGVLLDANIRYPDDRGLGGEGLPTHGEQVLSDVVGIYGGDDVTADLQAARDRK